LLIMLVVVVILKINILLVTQCTRCWHANDAHFEMFIVTLLVRKFFTRVIKHLLIHCSVYLAIQLLGCKHVIIKLS